MKKILSGILTIIAFISVLLATGLFIARSAFSGNSMGKMMTVALEDLEIENYDKLLEEILGDEYDSDMDKYFNSKKFEKELGKIASDYLLYSANVSEDEPSIDELRDLVENAIEKYEDKEDENVDTDMVDEFFDELEYELENTEVVEEEEVTEVLSVIFSTSLLLGSLAVALLCLAGIYALSKDIKKTVKRAGIISIIDGILVFGGGKLITFVLNKSGEIDEITMELVTVITDLVSTSGIICIILGIVLIVVAKTVLKNKTAISTSNEAIQNLDNSVIK